MRVPGAASRSCRRHQPVRFSPEIVEVGPFAVGFRNSLHADGDHFAYGPFGRHALRFETGGGTRCGVFHDRLPVRIVVRAPLRNLLPGVVYFAPVDVVFADRTRRGPPCQVGGRRGLRAVGVVEDELRPQAGLAVAHRAAPCDPLVVPAVAEDDAEFDLLLPCAGEPAADVGRNVETAQFVVGLGRTHDAVPVRVVSVYEEFVPAGGADIGPCRDDGFVEPDGAAQVGGRGGRGPCCPCRSTARSTPAESEARSRSGPSATIPIFFRRRCGPGPARKRDCPEPGIYLRRCRRFACRRLRRCPRGRAPGNLRRRMPARDRRSA